jgi:hypothetical protein
MIIGTAHSMMKEKPLAAWFWGEAVITVVYLLNRVPCKVVDGKTPFEVWYGRKLTVSHLKIFGCVVYVRNTTPHLKKLEDRGRKMIFVGYESGSKACRAYDPITGRVLVTRDVIFDEATKWDWDTKVETSQAVGTKDTFSVQYRVVAGQGGEATDGSDDGATMNLGSPMEVPASPLSAGPVAAPSVQLAPPPEQVNVDDMDVSYDGEGLRYRTMRNLIGAHSPPRHAVRETQSRPIFRMSDLGLLSYYLSIEVKQDNKSTISLINNPVHHDRSKHIEVRYHLIQEYANTGQLEVKFIRIEEQLGDILTKPLSKNKSRELSAKIGLIKCSK